MSNTGRELVLPIELRWEVQARDLNALWVLHEEAFPIAYDAAYYQWLVGPNCIGLVAFTTPTALAEVCYELRRRQSIFAEGSASSLSSSTAAAAASVAPPSPMAQSRSAASAVPFSTVLRPPTVSQQPLTAQRMAERAELQLLFAELQAAADDVGAETRVTSERNGASTGARNATPDRNEDDGGEGEEAETFTVPVGIIAGHLSYARHSSGYWLTNPTAYIGSFAVDARLRGCGVGDVMLRQFLPFLTRDYPLCAKDYLHYDEERMRRLVAATQPEEERTEDASSPPQAEQSEPAAPEGAPATSSSTVLRTSAADSPSVVGPRVLGWGKRLARLLLPEVLEWYDERADTRRGGHKRSYLAWAFTPRSAPPAPNPLIQKGVGEVWLHCLSSDEALVQFYCKRGFRVMQVLNDYYEFCEGRHRASLLLYTPPPPLPPAVQSSSSSSPLAATKTKAAEGETAAASATEVGAVAAPAARGEAAEEEMQQKLRSDGPTTRGTPSTGSALNIALLAEQRQRKRGVVALSPSPAISVPSTTDAQRPSSPTAHTESVATTAHDAASSPPSNQLRARRRDHGSTATAGHVTASLVSQHASTSTGDQDAEGLRRPQRHAQRGSKLDGAGGDSRDTANPSSMNHQLFGADTANSTSEARHKKDDDVGESDSGGEVDNDSCQWHSESAPQPPGEWEAALRGSGGGGDDVGEGLHNGDSNPTSSTSTDDPESEKTRTRSRAGAPPPTWLTPSVYEEVEDISTTAIREELRKVWMAQQKQRASGLAAPSSSSLPSSGDGSKSRYWGNLLPPWVDSITEGVMLANSLLMLAGIVYLTVISGVFR